MTYINYLSDFNPLGWMVAAISGLFSIPYFFSSSPVARKDTRRLPALVRRPPGVFGHSRRDEELPHHYQHLQQEQQPFEYDGWHWIWQDGEYVWQPIAPPLHPDLHAAHSTSHVSHTETVVPPADTSPTAPSESGLDQAQQAGPQDEPGLQPPTALQPQEVPLPEQQQQQQPQEPLHQKLQQQEQERPPLVPQRLVRPTPVRLVAGGRPVIRRHPIPRPATGNTDARRPWPFGQPRRQTPPRRQVVRVKKVPQHQKQRLPPRPPPRRPIKPILRQKQKVRPLDGRIQPPPVGPVGPQTLTPSLVETPGTFGSFRPVREGNSHFTVMHVDANDQVHSPTAPSPGPTVSSTEEPPSTISPPKAETGFKPIIPTEPPAPKVTVASPVTPLPLRAEAAPTAQPSNSGEREEISIGFKPIKPETKEKPEVTTHKISHVTSAIFKTSTTPPPPRPAIAQGLRYTTPRTVPTTSSVPVKTSTSRSVRVVTSTSVLYPGEKQPVKTSSSELKKPQRPQHFKPEPQQLVAAESVASPTVVKQQIAPSVSSFGAKVNQPAPAVPSPSPLIQSQTHSAPSLTGVAAKLVASVGPSTGAIYPAQQTAGVSTATVGVTDERVADAAPTPGVTTIQRGVQTFVRTNIPTEIRIVDHQAANQALTEAPTPHARPTPVPIYALDPFYGPRLSRIDAIFHQVNVHEEGCRMQLVCNIYKNPSAFTPVSDFLSRQLTVRIEDLTRPKTSDENLLRYFRYLKAAKNGQDDDICNEIYSECSQDTTLLTHQPIMNAYRTVSLLMDNRS
ncbi:uncharacterized protein LOC143033101 [Oratosquilla oratoria]|uniref:uncharacterized protein LOC143033101 n=1 Tax=Oratosquilla oratoria TaxID=337810 RepID=UPI003F7736F5